jgi:hypothetical protein
VLFVAAGLRLIDKEGENIDGLLLEPKEGEEVLRNESKSVSQSRNGPLKKMTHLVYGKGLVVVNDPYFTRVGRLDHVDLLNVEDVGNGQRDLDAVAVVARAEDYSLQALDPFLSRKVRVGAELIGPLVRRQAEIWAPHFLFFVGQRGRDGVS